MAERFRFQVGSLASQRLRNALSVTFFPSPAGDAIRIRQGNDFSDTG
jgi:hypothetical protein